MTAVKTRKKLIEVALPLEAINAASAREKSIRHGHPSTLHLWWARRPLASARAVIFSQMVDDPSEYVEELLGNPITRAAAERELERRRALYETQLTEADPGPAPRLEDCAADLERQRLFRIIEDLVKWENTTNEAVLQKACDEIWASWRRACADNASHPRAAELFNPAKLPAFHDPFAGGGALPLEAQRLGLEAHASDLNPVAVLINKAMIEIPPRFADCPPINPERDQYRRWKGAQGLAEDVRFYGKWMRDEAERRIGHLYPKVEVTAAVVAERPDLQPYLGKKLTVITWLWARTVRSPNPAFAEVEVPLASSFWLSTKPGKEAWVEPVVENNGYHFAVRSGKPENLAAVKSGTKLGGRGANFRCVMSDTPISGKYIKAEGKAGRIGARLMAIVAEGERGRVYLPPTSEQELAASEATPSWKPDVEFFSQALGFRVGNYGMTNWSDLYTDRQLIALTTFCDLVSDVSKEMEIHCQEKKFLRDDESLNTCANAEAYVNAVSTLLGLTSSKAARFTTTLATWRADENKLSRAFTRNDVPITWDFAETNPFSGTGGDLFGLAQGTADVLDTLPCGLKGTAMQRDAAGEPLNSPHLIATDPPYYDNIGYADLSDYFYVWLRHSLRNIHPELLATVTVPKNGELVATPARHGGSKQAEAFFLNGMTKAMRALAACSYPAFPVTIYYAFKQSEAENNKITTNTGWETFLDAVNVAGFSVSGTWPVRTEGKTRMRGISSNALASSIVLVCRPRDVSATTATRREFLAALKSELPAALRHLQKGNIAPVDLAQAAIGPGMAVFTRYARVVDAEGKALSVRDALVLINATLDEVLAEQEGDFDAESRWALAWFEHHGFTEGDYGVAEVLSKAKVTSVASLAEAGIIESRRGKVRLKPPAELEEEWDPSTEKRVPAWEMVHYIIRALEAGGDAAAAALVAKLGTRAEVARELAYRLYVIAERKRRAAEALSYNGLVQSWPEIARLAQEGVQNAVPADLFEAAER